MSEADLFLRLCPAPTIGVTGTKGKTTTSSLTAAILAADAAHPVVLGGNIGLPIVERLPELTPDHRVVDELSELQLPTLSRGTTVAVYTNVTSDHLDRHGTLEGYRRVKRRLAELVDPDGALVLNAEDPVVAGVRRRRPGARRSATGATRRCPAGSASSTAGSSPTGVERLGAGGRRRGRRPRPTAGSCRSPSWPSRAPTTSRTRWRRSRWALAFGVAPDAIRAAAAAFTRRRAPARAGRASSTASASSTTRRGPSPTPWSPPCAPSSRRSCSSPAAGTRASTCRRLAPVVGRARGRRGPHRRERARPRGGASGPPASPAPSARPTSTRRSARADALAREALAATPRGAGPATVLLSPAAASFDMFVDYAARGRAFKASVAALAATRAGRRGPMNLAPPIPRLERPRRAGRRPAARRDDRATANRTPVKSRAGALRRERHQADYVILVVVVALTAIGILMVYSSSALKGYLSQDADTFATVGPQIQWAILGLRRDGAR